MALTVGTRVGSYEVLGLLGAGGMGEVYRARDTKLKRDVALKVLPDAFASDADRLSRFEREAELLATLNHPNIAGIHGLEQVEGTTAIVLELVDGETIADRLARGRIPIDEALAIARQIADALEAAHDRGVVHRDLKPANIKITPDGTVKVLDFGLAKMIEAGAGSDASSGRSFSPTLSVHATVAGVILGTAAYMSPEQARGKPVDRRTDIWAYGCVLFEMLGGRQPFESGETVTDTVAAIIKNDPDWTSLPADTPARIRALLRRCLQKDPRRRLPHIGVARLEIDDQASEVVAGASGAAPGTRVTVASSRPPWIVAGVAVSLAAALSTVMVLHREPIEPRTIRLSISPPEGSTLGHNFASRGTGPAAPQFAPSPDGSRLAYVMYRSDQPPELWVHRFDALADQALPGTDDAAFPFWSPDSRFIGFFAQGKLKTIEASGGTPQIICDAPAGEGGTWNRDGDIVFAADETSGLSRVSAAGGRPVGLTTLDAASKQTSHRWPQFLPDGRHFLYLAMKGDVRTGLGAFRTPDDRGLYAASLDSAAPTLIKSDVLRSQYAAGRLLFMRGTSLMSQAFEPKSLRLTGDPTRVAEQVASNFANGRTAFAASDRVVAYRNGPTAGASGFMLAWFDRSGKRLEAVGAPGDHFAIALAPDGKTVAANIGALGNNSDLWILDLARGGIPSRLTFTADQAEAGLAWSPDGRRIAFAAGVNPTELYAKSVSGVGDAELLFKSERPLRPSAWSPDGRYVAFNETNSKGADRIMLLPLAGDRKPRAFLAESTYNEFDAIFSPDGRWVAYVSTKGGQPDIYIRPFPNGDREWRVSRDGGFYAQWRGDGRELFYLEPTSRAMMSVAISNGAAAEPAPPVKLFKLPLIRGAGNGQYSVTADGQRFLIMEPVSLLQAGSSPTPIVMEINWTHTR